MIKPWMLGALGGLIVGLTADNLLQFFGVLVGMILVAVGVAIGVKDNDT